MVTGAVVIIGCNHFIVGIISVMTGCVVIIGCAIAMGSVKVVAAVVTGATKPDIVLHCKLAKIDSKEE